MASSKPCSPIFARPSCRPDLRVVFRAAGRAIPVARPGPDSSRMRRASACLSAIACNRLSAGHCKAMHERPSGRAGGSASFALTREGRCPWRHEVRRPAVAAPSHGQPPARHAGGRALATGFTRLSLDDASMAATRDEAAVRGLDFNDCFGKSCAKVPSLTRGRFSSQQISGTYHGFCLGRISRPVGSVSNTDSCNPTIVSPVGSNSSFVSTRVHPNVPTRLLTSASNDGSSSR